MARKAAAFLMTVCLLFAAEAGAISGNEWKQLPDMTREGYVYGVVDAWANFTQMIEPSGKPSTSGAVRLFTDLSRCVRKGMTYGETIAIVHKYMENNPSQWHSDMSSLVWTALNEVCGFKDK